MTEDKTTGVARGGADGEVGDGVVGEDGGLRDEVDEAAKTRATDHPENWPHLTLHCTPLWNHRKEKINCLD